MTFLNIGISFVPSVCCYGCVLRDRDTVDGGAEEEEEREGEEFCRHLIEFEWREEQYWNFN
jgi:hypothetical protein